MSDSFCTEMETYQTAEKDAMENEEVFVQLEIDRQESVKETMFDKNPQGKQWLFLLPFILISLIALLFITLPV